MLYTGQFVANVGPDSEFFFQFPAQRIPRLFPFLNFSARELPLQGHSLMARTLAHEQLVFLQNQGRDDALHGGEVACRALATGSTQLVKVKAKAATPVEQRSSSSCSAN